MFVHEYSDKYFTTYEECADDLLAVQEELITEYEDKEVD